MSPSGPYAFLRPHLLRNRGPFLAAFAFLTLETFSDLMQPTLMSHLVNQGILAKDEAALGFWGLMMLGFVVLGAAGALCRNAISSAVSQRLGTEVRRQTFEHVMLLRFDQVRRWDASSIITRLTFDVAQVQGLANGLMRIYMKAPILGLGALVLAFSLNPGLALCLLPIFPVVALLVWRQLDRTLPLFQKTQVLLDALNSRVRDFLHGIRVIKAFGRQDEEREKFRLVNDDLARVSTLTQVIQASFAPTLALTVNAGVILVLWAGGILTPEGGRPIGALMAFVQYLSQILFSLAVISMFVGSFSRARTSARRMGEVLGTVPETTASRAVEPASGPGLAVAFEDVGLSYGGEPVLTGLSFSLEPGGRLGILGSTGSGKTSVLHLLLGFLPPTEGRVVVPEANNPGLFGFVSQRPLLFRGTIRENLLWGRPGADDADLDAALWQSDALDFVLGFPEGLDTLLGPGGVNLSGGQKQRITLARALVRRPKILVLDEASSALDQATESRIGGRLRTALPGMAVVQVAQKVSSVQSYPHILVLDDGRNAGWGSHLDLLAASPVYRQIAVSQGWEP